MNNRPGAQPENQNARKRGWYSKHDPAPMADLIAAGQAAILERDPETLRAVARVLGERGYTTHAARLRRLARQLEAQLGIEAAGVRIPAATMRRIAALLQAPDEEDTADQPSQQTQ